MSNIPALVQPKVILKPVGNGYSSTDPDGEGGGGPEIPAGEFVITGTVAHGSEITITTDAFDFGARENVKPLYVNLGEAKAGSALGRVATDRFDASAVHQTEFKNGSSAGATKFDFKGKTVAAWGNFDCGGTKPIIQYSERYYFDINDPSYQNESGGVNLKTDRIWSGSSPSGQNLYFGYQGSEGAKSSRINMEYVGGNSAGYYSKTVPAGQWLNEEHIVINSSAPTIKDGVALHYRNNILLNVDLADQLYITMDSGTYSTPLRYKFLDQISNGSGSASEEVPVYYGTLILDDEWNAVYVGNAATRSACTKLVRLPQTAWGESQVKAIFAETFVSAESAYFYIRTGRDAWVSDTGYQQ